MKTKLLIEVKVLFRGCNLVCDCTIEWFLVWNFICYIVEIGDPSQ